MPQPGWVFPRCCAGICAPGEIHILVYERTHLAEAPPTRPQGRARRHVGVRRESRYGLRVLVASHRVARWAEAQTAHMKAKRRIRTMWAAVGCNVARVVVA